jgi:hypothetical protein
MSYSGFHNYLDDLGICSGHESLDMLASDQVGDILIGFVD